MLPRYNLHKYHLLKIASHFYRIGVDDGLSMATKEKSKTKTDEELLELLLKKLKEMK